jgi:hypothetical protein
MEDTFMRFTLLNQTEGTLRRNSLPLLLLAAVAALCLHPPSTHAQDDQKDLQKPPQAVSLDWGATLIPPARPATTGRHLIPGTVNSSWNGGTGNWSTSSDWNPNGVPNNGGGNTYNVTIDSGGTDLVSLDLNATINSLVLGGSTGSSTLQNLSGSAETLNITGALTVNKTGQLNFGNGSTLNVGTLINNGSVTIGQGSTLNLTNQPNGITDVVAGSTLDVAGTFNAGTNNGLAKLNSIEGNLILENGQTTTVTPGSGTLTVSNSGSLTLNNGSTLNVSGNLAPSTLTLINSTLAVSGNLNGGFYMQYANFGTLAISGNMTGGIIDCVTCIYNWTVNGTFTNEGTYLGPEQNSDIIANFGKLINNADLGMECCIYMTTGTLINNSTIELYGDAQNTLTVKGTLTNQAGAQLYVGEGVNEVTASTLVNKGTIDLFQNYSGPTLNLTAAGTLTNSGVITLNEGEEGCLCTIIGIGANVSLTGGGIVTMSHGAISGTTGSPTFTNLNNTIEGSGNIGNGQMALNNKGLIDANDTSNPLMIQTNKGTVNTGTLEATGGGTLVLDGNTFKNTGGTIQANGAGSMVLLESGAIVTGGTLSTSSSGLIETPSGQTATLSGLTNSGAYVMANNSTTFLSGKITNTGTISLDSTGDNTIAMIPTGGATLQGSGTLTLGTGGPNMIEGSNGKEVLTNASTIQGAGTISNLGLTNTGTILANAGTLTIAPSTSGYAFRNNGNLTVDSGSTVNITGPVKLSFQTAGTVTINSGGALTVGGSATYAQTKGATTVDGNLSASNGISISGGTVFGNMGTLAGNFNLSGTGAISPGDGIMKVGELTINGMYAQGSTASALIDLGGTGSGAFDLINISKAAALNGKLIVDLVNGFNPVAGNTFDIMNYASESGAFSSETLPTVAGDHWLVTIGATDVLLQLLTGTGPTKELRTSSAHAGLGGAFTHDGDFAGAFTGYVPPSALPPAFDTSGFSNSDSPQSPTPEPSTLLLLGSAFLGMGAFARRHLSNHAVQR